MFAHCLLPALLLLAAVDAKPPALAALDDSFEGFGDQYTTVTDKGDLNVPLGQMKESYIADKQCTGAIPPIKEDPQLKCPGGQVVARVQVIVVDYAPGTQTYIADDLDSATITRSALCDGAARVQVRVGCRPGLHSRSYPRCVNGCD